jgi:hypothetical protein
MSYFEQRMAELAAAKKPAYNAPPIDRRKPKPPITGTKKGHIYFIGLENSDLVKIGFATNLANRLETLQTGNPEKMHFEESFLSYREAEKLLHRRFKADHVRGEWFRLSNDIEELIEDLFDYRACHAELAPDGSGKVFLENTRKVFIGLEHLQMMLDALHEEWPEGIFEGANFAPDPSL